MAELTKTPTFTMEQMRSNKALSDQIRLSVVQGILQVIGHEHVVKVFASQIESDKLQPAGVRLEIKLSVDIYPKT